MKVWIQKMFTLKGQWFQFLGLFQWFCKKANFGWILLVKILQKTPHFRSDSWIRQQDGLPKELRDYCWAVMDVLTTAHPRFQGPWSPDSELSSSDSSSEESSSGSSEDSGDETDSSSDTSSAGEEDEEEESGEDEDNSGSDNEDEEGQE